MSLLPPSGRERRRALGLLAILTGLVVWVWWPVAPLQPTASPEAGAEVGPVSQGGPAPLGAGPLPESVRLTALGVTSAGLAVGRNVFRFGARPAPPPPPPQPASVAGPPPAPPRPLGPPPVPLRLAGRMEAPGGRVVVTLRDGGSGALFHASEGDVVDGRYRLLKVGVQSVVVSYLDGSGQRTIALGGG